MRATSEFTVGGPVPPQSRVYIKRATDDELFLKLVKGESCFIAGPSQVGKSSLIKQTRVRLEEYGIKVVELDLLDVREKDPEKWFDEFCKRLSAEAKIQSETRVQGGNAPGGVSRLQDLFAAIGRRGAAVIFFDEINVLVLPERETARKYITEALIAAERSRIRGRRPDLANVTFGVAGYMRLEDLRREGEPRLALQTIKMRDFDRSQILEGFGPVFENRPKGAPSAWCEEVYNWTSGHPYLTQWLCKNILSARLVEPDAVNQHVGGLIKRGDLDELPVIKGIAERIEGLPSLRQSDLIDLYQTLLVSGQQLAKDCIEEIDARLVGLIEEHSAGGKRYIDVRNQIISAKCDLDWCEDRLMNLKVPIREAARSWVAHRRSNEYLLRPRQLQEYAARFDVAKLTTDEQALIQESRKQISRSKARVVVFLAFLIVSVALAVVSVLYIYMLDAEEKRRNEEAKENKLTYDRAREELKLPLEQHRGDLQALQERRSLIRKNIVTRMESALDAPGNNAIIEAVRIDNDAMEMFEICEVIENTQSKIYEDCHKELIERQRLVGRIGEEWYTQSREAWMCESAQCDGCDAIPVCSSRNGQAVVEPPRRNALEDDLRQCDKERGQYKARAETCEKQRDEYKAKADACAEKVGSDDCEAKLDSCQRGAAYTELKECKSQRQAVSDEVREWARRCSTLARCDYFRNADMPPAP